MLATIERAEPSGAGLAVLTLLPQLRCLPPLTLTLLRPPASRRADRLWRLATMEELQALVGVRLWLGAGIILLDGRQELWARFSGPDAIYLVSPRERDKWSWADVWSDLDQEETPCSPSW